MRHSNLRQSHLRLLIAIFLVGALAPVYRASGEAFPESRPLRFRDGAAFETLLSNARMGGGQWRYVTEAPEGDWRAAAYDDSAWPVGEAGFGTAHTPNTTIGTPWDGESIWLRRTFILEDLDAEAPLAWMIHYDEDPVIYLNGAPAAQFTAWNGDYGWFALAPQAVAALQKGENTIALHARQTHGGQFIDVGLVRYDPAERIVGPEVEALFDFPLRDTSICIGHDGAYYLTGTTGHPTWWETNAGIRVWRSEDLNDWTPLGLVWSIEEDGTWQKAVRDGRRAVWAPEIHYLKGTYWLAYCMNWPEGGTGLLKSVSGLAQGPWRDISPDGPLTDEIDASLFQDDDGAVYFVYQNGKIARMRDDMSGLAEEPRLLQPANADQVGFEGAQVFKANGRYYLSCAEFNGPYYDCMIASSDHLDGPWGDAVLAIPHAGHNVFFQDRSGRWMSTYFGNDQAAAIRERPAVLPVVLERDGAVRAATAAERRPVSYPAPPPAVPAAVARPELMARAVADPMTRTYITPRRVLWQTEGDSAQNSAALLRVRSGQVTLDASDPCVLRTDGDGPAGVLVDFGVQLHGAVQIMAWHTRDNKPVRLRVRFGESASEAMAEIGGPQNATNDHAIRDQSVLAPWLGSVEVGPSGFRFVRVDLEDADSFVQLMAIRAVLVHRDLEYRGSFRSSDDRLNRIWMTGAWSVHLNMQDYLWDGIKRDRLVWVGDMHPETMSILAVFGADPVIPRSLDLIRDETPLPGWMNGISSYSMWWVLLHHTWFHHTGDRVYLEGQRAYLKGLLEMLAQCVGEDNREALPPHRFLDWPTSENGAAIHAGLHSLLVMTLQAGAELCEALGEEGTRATCLEATERLLRHTPDPADSKQAAALMALAGLGDGADLNERVLAVGGGQGMSTFYGYYVLQAMAQAGDHQGAMDCIREYWGAMLDLGATTFWEDFNLEWTENAAPIDELVPEGKKDIHGDFGAYCYEGFRHSLCHGWASGPTAWLSEHVLGVQVLAPGGRVLRIQPHLGDLDWVEGTYPTPMGVVRIRHERRDDGSIHSAIDAPEGVEIQR